MASSNLYVTGLPNESDESSVTQIFSAYGSVSSVKVLPPRPGSPAVALVRFTSPDEAQWLVENMNGNIPEGLDTPIEVKFANDKGSKGDSKGDDGGYGKAKGVKGGYGDKGKGSFGKDKGPYGGGAPGAAAPSTNLYISGLPAESDEAAVVAIFTPYGEVVSSKVLPPRPGAPAVALVRFATMEEAEWLVQNLNGNIPEGLHTPIEVRYAQSKGKGEEDSGKGVGKDMGKDKGGKGGYVKGDGGSAPNTNLYISGLPNESDEVSVTAVFSAYGSVSSVKVLPPREGLPAVALVRFSSLDEAQWLVENINGNIPEGLNDPIEVKFANDSGGKDKGGKGKDAFITPPPAAQGAVGKGVSDVSNNLYISGLPAESDENFVSQVFAAYGSVVSVKVLPPKPGCPAVALVRFGSVPEAQWLVDNLNGNIPEGLNTPVDVKFANQPGSKGDDGGYGKDKGGKGFGKDFGKEHGKDRAVPYGDYQGKGKGGKNGGEAACDIKTLLQGLIDAEVYPGQPRHGEKLGEDHQVFVRGLPADTQDIDLYRMFSPFGAIAPNGVRAMRKDDRSCSGIGFVDFMDASVAQLAMSTLHGTQMGDGSVLEVVPKRAQGEGKGGKGKDKGGKGGKAKW